MADNEILREEEDVIEEKTNSEEQVIKEDENDVETAEVLEDKEFEEIKDDNELENLKEENFNLKDDLTKANNECEALKDRLLRVTAEYDNFRKRTSKEKEGIYNDACADVLKNILPVLDNLERAVTADGSVEDLKKGIEMTLRQFNDALDKLQVEEIPTDIEFDPNLHSAVMHVEDENLGANAIVDVFQKGYKRDSKVIRYSMVKVAN